MDDVTVVIIFLCGVMIRPLILWNSPYHHAASTTLERYLHMASATTGPRSAPNLSHLQPLHLMMINFLNFRDTSTTTHRRRITFS